MINRMNQCLKNFHQLNNVFSQFWIRKRGKKTIAKKLAKAICQLVSEVLNDISQ